MTMSEMTNHPNRSKPYELSFWGGAFAQVPRYKRKHATYDEAADEAVRVLMTLDNRGAHPAIVYGPGCGRDGRTIS
jgi:hypothetical protein